MLSEHRTQLDSLMKSASPRTLRIFAADCVTRFIQQAYPSLLVPSYSLALSYVRNHTEDAGYRERLRKMWEEMDRLQYPSPYDIFPVRRTPPAYSLVKWAMWEEPRTAAWECAQNALALLDDGKYEEFRTWLVGHLQTLLKEEEGR